MTEDHKALNDRLKYLLCTLRDNPDDRMVYNELFDKIYPVIVVNMRHFLFARMQTRHDVERELPDACQMACERIMRKLPTYDETRSAPLTWMIGIAGKVACEIARTIKNDQNRNCSLDENWEEDPEEPCKALCLEFEISERMFQERLRAFINRLDCERTILFLRKVIKPYDLSIILMSFGIPTGDERIDKRLERVPKVTDEIIADIVNEVLLPTGELKRSLSANAVEHRRARALQAIRDILDDGDEL